MTGFDSTSRSRTEGDQLDLLAEGERLRDEGMQRADDNADDFWKRTVNQAIRHLASTGREFTSDDVRALGVPEPISSKAWGPRYSAAAKAGLIVNPGGRRRKSTHPATHGATVAVWVGAAFATAGEAA